MYLSEINAHIEKDEFKELQDLFSKFVENVNIPIDVLNNKEIQMLFQYKSKQTHSLTWIFLFKDKANNY